MSWDAKISMLGELRHQESLSAHTTLGIGGPARWYFRPANMPSLLSALPLIPASTLIMPMGRGSNLLVPDQGIDGLIMDLSHLDTIETTGKTLTAGAGARMGKTAQAAANAGLAGLEFMATVPGDIGGGIAMNAGAFGQQVSDTLKSITLCNRHGETRTLQRSELDMQYRHTALPEQALVLSACFTLSTDSSMAIRERIRQMRAKRSASQPLAMPNCGSVFKNPQGDHAARLIEAAGLKGTRVGHARISDMHANFIINEGGASYQDVLQLIRMARQQVHTKFDILLEPEVRMLGEQP